MPLLLFLALATAAFAQRGGVPPAVFHAPQKVTQPAPGQRLELRAAPERWMAPLTAEERTGRRVRAGLTQVGVHRSVSAAEGEGSWQTARDGSSVWRLVLRSPSAVALRLHLENFHAGDGQLWITELLADRPQTYGPYEGDGIHGDGEFWTNTALGEAVLIEYQTRSRSRTVPFRIAEISHLTELPITVAKPGPDMGLAKLGETRAAALSCNIDVTCREEYAELARAVARISFETGDGSALCSGTVLNTRASSFIPYFMTAAHCISTDAEARTVEAFFLYQTLRCNGPAPTAADVRRALGSRYVAGSTLENGDFTLLRLNSVPDGTIFAGWTADEHPVGAAVTGIHHPTGDLKKISFGARGDAITTRGRPTENFYTVLWREGVTQGGSSGSGIFNDQGQIVGMLSGGPRPPAGQTECDLRPAFDWYGRFDVAFPQIRTFLEDRAGSTNTGGGTTTPPTGTALTNNTPLRLTLPAVNATTLIGGNNGWRIQVPEGATELEITLATATANADLDLFVSYEAAPSITGGRVVSDYSSISDSGNERILINAQSNPPLRAGTYFIAIANFSTGREVSATLNARIGTPGTGGGASQAVALTSGVSRTFNLPAVTNGTLFTGAAGYRIDVPANATQLQIRVNTTTPNSDVDLYTRFGAEVTLEGGRPVAEFRSTSDGGNELITINAQSSPALRAGTYFIALGLFTPGVATSGTITATFTTQAPVATPIVLSSGVARPVSLPVTTGPTLFPGDRAFQITVPEGATRLKIDLRTSTATDVDMFVTFGDLGRVVNGKAVADFSSEGPDGNESITISTTTSPALKPGVYFIQFVNYDNQRAAEGTITATIERTPVAPTAPTVLASGVAAKLQLPAVTGPTVFTGAYGYRIQVPNGATRLTIRLTTSTPNTDVDLYARHEADVDVSAEGDIIADHYSETLTGNESIIITASSNPPLRPGTYYIATGLYTEGVIANGTITATVERAPSGTPQVGQELSFDQPVTFNLPAVENSTLFGGANVFRVNVNQPGGLKFELRTATGGVDVDIHVRFQQPPAVENGRIASDFSATGDAGDEDLTVLPNLIGNRLGTYYVALAVYTPGVPITGTLRVTPIVPGGSGDAKREESTLLKERGGEHLKPKVSLRGE
jgi:hypothetical protein